MTHDELADAAHVARITIRRFLSGEKVSEGTIEAIAKPLEMEPEEIVDPVEWRNRKVANTTGSSFSSNDDPELTH